MFDMTLAFIHMPHMLFSCIAGRPAGSPADRVAVYFQRELALQMLLHGPVQRLRLK